MAVGDDIQEGIAGVGEGAVEAVERTDPEFSDIPTIESEPQTMVDEDAINEQFDPAHDAFDGLREGGEWLFKMVADFFGQVASYFT